MARNRKKRANLIMNFGDNGFYKRKKYFKRFKRRKRRGGY